MNLVKSDKEKLKAQKKKEIIKNNVIKNANKMLRNLTLSSTTPYSLSYFTQLLKRTYSDLEDIDRKKDVKTIGIYCVMVPEEIIYAAGAIPVKLCGGNHMAAAVGDEVTPKDACPLVKAVMGTATMPLFPVNDSCHNLIIPTTCDCKRKIIEELEKYKSVFPLHVPALRENDESKLDFIEELKSLVNYLEEVTGNKITQKNLYHWTMMISEAQKEIYKLYTFQKMKPSIIRGSQVMAVLNSYSFDTVERWTSALKTLNGELTERAKLQTFIAKKKTPRIMVIGSPIIFPNFKIPFLIEEVGGVLAIDETCAGSRWMCDPVVITDKSIEGLLRAYANRYILPCTCPTFVDNKQRIFKLKQMIEDFQIDGVVYHVLRGCLPYDSEANMIEDAFSEIGIPSIKVETDYNEEDIEQLRIRFEAFMELIKYKNKKQ